MWKRTLIRGSLHIGFCLKYYVMAISKALQTISNLSPVFDFVGNMFGGIFSSTSASADAEANRQFQRQERLETQEW